MTRHLTTAEFEALVAERVKPCTCPDCIAEQELVLRERMTDFELRSYEQRRWGAAARAGTYLTQGGVL